MSRLAPVVVAMSLAAILAFAMMWTKPRNRLTDRGSNSALAGASFESRAASSVEQLYIQVCASCHGSALQGGVGPSLQNLAERRSTQKVERIIMRGKGRKRDIPMPGGLVSREQAGTLAAWLTQVPGPRFTTATTTQRARTGAAIYVGACASCHGAHLEGTIGPALDWVGRKYAQAEIEQIILNGRQSESGAIMPDGLVSPEEAAIVASWLITRNSIENR